MRITAALTKPRPCSSPAAFDLFPTCQLALNELHLALDERERLLEIVRDRNEKVIGMGHWPAAVARGDGHVGALFRQPPRGNVARDRVHQTFRSWHRGPGQPAIAAVLAPESVFEAEGGLAPTELVQLRARRGAILEMHEGDERSPEQVRFRIPESPREGRVQPLEVTVVASHAEQVE